MKPRREGVMKIVVLNGSPKGGESVTMQYVAYLERRFPQHEWQRRDVALSVEALDAKPERWAALGAELAAADAVLWAFPLYFMLVTSAYKRFIELLLAREGREWLAGKPMAALSTSIHFFDHAAHNYLRGIGEDLGGTWLGSYSAEMDDLLKPAERERLTAFGAEFLRAAAAREPRPRATAPLPLIDWAYQPGHPPPVVGDGRSTLILTDLRPGDGGNLPGMVQRLAAGLGGSARVVSLWDVDIKGGCLGCCRCALDNECAWEGKDGFTTFYREQVMTADRIVFAAAITDRNLSWKWRQFFDRSFFRGHAPSLGGKQFGFLLAGPLAQLSDLRQTLEAWTQLQGSGLVDIVSDEPADSATLDAVLDGLAQRLAGATAYAAPPTFPAVAGRKLFRDAIWGDLRLVFQADHAAYRRERRYDFPQRDWTVRLRNALLLPLSRIPKIRAIFKSRMKSGMIAPFARVLAATEPLGEGS
jgi:multimeric flavodoxin WrbA